MFEEAFKNSNLSYDQFDPLCSYSFVLQHPMNRIVRKYFKPKLILVQVVKINDDGSYTFLDYHNIGSKLCIENTLNNNI